MSDEKPRVISRRDILKGAGAVAATAAVGGAVPAPGTTAPGTAAPGTLAPAAQAPAVAAREALETLTAQEADLLDLIAARLIPSDALGPGAREAKVVRYIDRALGGALARLARRVSLRACRFRSLLPHVARQSRSAS